MTLSNKSLAFDRRTAKIARYIPITKDGRRGSPVSIQVALTDRCFNRCIGCGHPLRSPRSMTAAQWLAFLGTIDLPESVCYSGGDPMAFREFNEVMQWHVENGVEFGATITGYVPEYINVALLARAAWVRVSLDAVDAELYEKVRGKTPLFKVMDGIDKMLAAGVKVGLGITVHPDNEHHYPDVLAWAKTKGITDVDARYAYPNSNPRWADVSLDGRGVKDFEHCSAVFYQLYIDADGSVYPCCVTAGDTRDGPTAAALGNILTEHWNVIWPRVVEYSRLRKADLPDVCRKCCVQRLSEINHVNDLVDSSPSFF